MTLLLQLLTAAVLITAMVLLRLFSWQRSSRLRMKCDPGSGGCSETECFHGCGGAAPLAKSGRDPGN
jgi:hypothetical protein